MDFNGKTTKIRILLMLLIIAIISFFGMPHISAYYQKNVLRDVEYETTAYQDITYSLNKSIYASCNDSATVNLTLTNFNDYALLYTLSFSNSTPSYLIDGAQATTYTLPANTSKTNSIAITGATGTNITVTIDVISPYSKTYTKTINFDNVCPTVSFNPNTSGTYAQSASVTVTVTDNDSHVKAGQSLKYKWQNNNVCPTSSSGYTSLALSNTNFASITATATVPASGYTGEYYLCIYKDIEDVAGNKSIITASGSFLFDNTPPNCTWGNWSASKIGPNQTATIALTCTDSHSGVPSTTFAASLSNSSVGSLGVPSVSGNASSRVFTFTITGGTTSGSTSAVLPGSGNNVVKDNATNIAETKTSTSMIEVDATPPEVTFGTNGNTTYATSQATTVTATDASGVSTLKYLWTQTSGTSAANGTTFTSGDSISNNTGTGLWYLCIYAADPYGNVTNTCSNAFYLDNTAPTITANDFCIRKGTIISALAFASAYDNDSGISGSITATINDTAVTDLSGYAVGTYTITYSVSDVVGNSATQDVTMNVYMLAADIPVVTSGNGLYTDQFTSTRKAFRGASPNNYLTLGGITWRILGIESDGTIKLATDSVQPALAYWSGYNYNNNGQINFNGSTIKTYLNGTFLTNLETAIDDSAVYGQIVQNHQYSVGGITYIYYSSTYTISQMITQENATKSSFAVGLMNPSDIARASNNTNGCKPSTTLSNSGDCYKNNSNYLAMTGDNAKYLLMNPEIYNNDHNAMIARTSEATTLFYNTSPGTATVYRAVIYLKADTKLQGAGTSASPYTVSAACSGTSAATCTITTGAGYDTSKTLTVNPTTNGATISNYVWSNGESGASKTSIIASTSGTYTVTLYDSDNLTNTCSISLSSRTEYRQATCTSPTYTNWVSYVWSGGTSCSSYELELSKGECLGTYKAVSSCQGFYSGSVLGTGLTAGGADAACNSGNSRCCSLLPSSCGGGEGYSCYVYPEMRVSTRSCSTCNAQGAWGAWQTTPIEQNTCTIVIDTRTAIGQS